MNTITLGSLFDGVSGFPCVASWYGIEPVWASEIEAAPMRIASRHFPNMKQLGDITKIRGDRIQPVDVITFGSPCFPAGTLVLTESGYKSIEDVRVGDKVLTHKGRWRNVTATGSKSAETVILKGNHYGLECTPNHPIYTTGERKHYPYLENGKRDNITLLTEEKSWVHAEDMLGRLWAVPNRVDSLPIDLGETPTDSHQNPMPEFSDDFFYFVGRWIGDEWVRDGQRSNRPIGQTWGMILLCDSIDKEDEICSIIRKISDTYSVSRERTVVKVKFHSQILCNWLTSNFGKYAIGKRMPGWVFGMPESYRVSLLKGLIESDGHKVRDGVYKINTVSKQLAEGIRLLGESLNYSTTVSKTIVEKTKMIENRIVNQHDWYSVSLTEISDKRVRTHYRDDTHGWYRVRKVIKTNEVKTVYNLSVEEDESYIADGIVVHNCQDLSIAGKVTGISMQCDECGYTIGINDYDNSGICPECGAELASTRSGLFLDAIRIIREMRSATNECFPKIAVWENVQNALSSNNGDDFYIVLKEFCDLIGERLPVLRPQKWSNAGEIVGDNGSIAWRILDAQYWGVPQRRRRIFLVCDLRGRSAGEICFKPKSLRGHSPTCKTPWEKFTGTTRKSVDSADAAEKISL